MKYLAAILILISFYINSYAQEIRAGITLGGNLYQKTKVDLPIFLPKNSYLIILEEDKGKGILNTNNVLNSYNLGGIVSVFYKKFSFSIEPQYIYKRSRLEFRKPQIISWILMEKGFRMPMYFSYRITKSAKSVELLTGLTLFKTKTIDFQEPTLDYSVFGHKIYEGQFYYGRNIFNNVLYNNKTYLMFLLGFKKPLKKWDMIVKFQRYINAKKSIDAEYFQVELSFNRYIFNSKSIINKHYLYVE